MKQKGLTPILIVILIALGIGGYLLYQKQSKSIPQSVTQPLPSPVASSASGSAETAKPDSIGANRKTYANTTYKYSIEYPSSWRYKFLKKSDVAGGVVAYETWYTGRGDENINSFSITSFEDGVNPPIKTTFENTKTTMETLVEEKIINNQRVKQITTLGGTQILVGLFKNKNINYIFTFQGYPNSQELKDFNQILSTFKFTN